MENGFDEDKYQKIKSVEFGNKIEPSDGRVSVTAYLAQDFGENKHCHTGTIDLRVIYDDSHKQLYRNAKDELRAFLTHILDELNHEPDE